MSKTYIADEPSLTHLVNQWHPTKNSPLTPQNTQRGSGRSILWVCSDDARHEWTATPLARSSQNQGCPFCAGKRVLAGYNDLATVNPELAAQWHPTKNNEFTAQEVSASSNKKAWWKCINDHEWEATINSRNTGNKCPYCSNRKVLAGFNDLATIKPDIATEWHPTKNSELKPSIISPTSNKKVWWICSEKHEWEAIIANRTAKGSGCPICYKNGISKKHKTVSENPKLLQEWSALNSKKASEVTLGSNFRAQWVCSKNAQHVWEAPVVNRSRGSGCLVCSNRKIITGINDLASSENFQHLVKEWHPANILKPSEVGIGTDVVVQWKCSYGHEWYANIYNRTVKNQSCPECLGRTKQGETRLKVSDYPALVSSWHSSNTLKPQDVSFQSSKKVYWVCPKNDKHVWHASPVSRSVYGGGCPVCAGRLIIKGVNDLASKTAYTHLVNQWHPDNDIYPDEVSLGSNIPIKWKCDKDGNHVWMANVYTRTKKDASGCPRCALARSTSKGEEEVFAVLTLLGVNPVANVTNAIRNRELDIYVPDKKFAVEFNGLYWHSEAIRPDKMYHANKQAACVAQGIQMFNVWEDDWVKRRNIVIRGLAHRLGATDKLPLVIPEIPSYWHEKIGARSTAVVSLNTAQAREFLDTHHIQGFTSGKYYLGLQDKQERLRAVLVLSTTANVGELRIDRYATAGTVAGGFTKLLAYAERNLPVNSWLTFADLAISDGGLYEAHGFVLDKVLDVDYSYLVRGERVHKFNYRLQRFEKDPELFFQEGLTERELADLNNLYRIWDFGKNRYVKSV